ncbi:MAG: hypothetical protein K1X57_10975 [Gemmataceae bacterium]|nr:hypothetical protein [Gemmataceae bacterium]
MQAELYPYNTPPWLRSHAATSPDGAVAAVITEAFEHSMSNPTVGTLRTSDGLELTKCNPAFLWSDDSRYLAVPRWCRRFGLFLRQRLAVVDVAARVVYVSRFTHWLMLPTRFAGGELEVRVSSRFGISGPWREPPLVLAVPAALDAFIQMVGAYGCRTDAEPGAAADGGA